MARSPVRRKAPLGSPGWSTFPSRQASPTHRSVTAAAAGQASLAANDSEPLG